MVNIGMVRIEVGSPVTGDTGPTGSSGNVTTEGGGGLLTEGGDPIVEE